MSLIVRIRKKLSHFTLDVDFETADHFTCLLGASGSGKSMLLKCIAGLEKPDEGYIELNGRVLFDSSKKIDVKPQERGVGYLFQNYALFPNMTVKENILVSRYRERNRPEVIKRLHELISLLQLEGHEDKYPDRISGGQQQRTALARIMMSNPGILLLDEPFAALDANLREKLQMEMKDLLTEYGQQVIMVTHDRDEAYRMSDAAGVLEDGRLIVYKPTRELFADPETVSAASMIGCKNIVPVQKQSENELFVPEWGIRMTMTKPLPPETTHIGIKAHHFGNNKDYVFPVNYCGGMEDTFEHIIRFRFDKQKQGSADIWWKLPYAQTPETLPDKIGFNEKDILLLHQEVKEC
ncbi:MAG: ATP-binding cassette domain-containing protein [Erysipelotrichaceae bacterium]|nr:ATP-binding cassette domain-containing protein [Erysipelotrichaceae bacterium]